MRKGYIKGIIRLPPNLFYGTGIPACIVVMDKEDAQARKGIFMIDARGGFLKDGPTNLWSAKILYGPKSLRDSLDPLERTSRADSRFRRKGFAN